MTRMHFSHLQLALFLLLACIVVSTFQALTCPEGQKLYQSRCYGVFRPGPKCHEDFNQTKAEAFCQSNGGELASIHSQAQNDFITALIKSTQHAHAKKLAAKAKCGCHIQQKDYLYWIGLELTHSGNGSVNGASWTDGTPVDYGNPLSANFRPPFVTGRPIKSAGDGSDPLEVCPPGNENKCVQIYGYGSTTTGKWTDKHCSDIHIQNVTCGCNSEEGNSTAVAHKKDSSSSSSSSASADDEDVIDECRDEAALNGLICKRCPPGWTPFQNHCYKAINGPQLAVQFEATCASFGGAVSSIHSAAENQFVSALALASAPGSASNLIGLTMTRASLAQNAAVTSIAWSDATPVDYGNAMIAPWSARGVYPWGTGSVAPQYPPQPDNVPAPGTCAFQWQNTNFQLISEWEDVPCAGFGTDSAVCKI